MEHVNANVGIDKIPTPPSYSSVITLKDGRLMWMWGATAAIMTAEDNAYPLIPWAGRRHLLNHPVLEQHHEALSHQCRCRLPDAVHGRVGAG